MNEGKDVDEEKNKGTEPVLSLKKIMFWKFLLLGFITFGVYALYTMWRFTKSINQLCEGEGGKSPNYFIVIFLSVVTFGIYGLYWVYSQGKRLYQISPKYYAEVKQNGMTYLLWNIFWPGIGGLISTYLLFRNYNSMVDNYNNGNIQIGVERKQKVSAIQKILLVIILFINILFWGFFCYVMSRPVEEISENSESQSVVVTEKEPKKEEKKESINKNGAKKEEQAEDKETKKEKEESVENKETKKKKEEQVIYNEPIEFDDFYRNLFNYSPEDNLVVKGYLLFTGPTGISLANQDVIRMLPIEVKNQEMFQFINMNIADYSRIKAYGHIVDGETFVLDDIEYIDYHNENIWNGSTIIDYTNAESLYEGSMGPASEYEFMGTIVKDNGYYVVQINNSNMRVIIMDDDLKGFTTFKEGDSYAFLVSNVEPPEEFLPDEGSMYPRADLIDFADLGFND